MKAKLNQNIKRESGITLIALIITIIVLVILAAVTIKSIWEMNIVKIAGDAVIDYTSEQQKELNTLDDITKILGQITGDDLTLQRPTVTLTGTKGNENVYSSDVSVRIKDSMSVATLAELEMHYIIEGLNDGREETVQGRETSITATEEGRYKVIAWIQDDKGNKSENEEVEFVIDKSKPSDPRISLTGTEGDNEYYIDNKVGVTIEAGENIVSGVSAIKYRVEGANNIAETTVYADTANFEIETDGESTIYAKIINNAGAISEEINRKMKKDSKDPNLATTAYVSHDITTITIKTTAQDTMSGLAKVEYQYSTNGSSYTTKSTSTYSGTTAETTNNSYTFTGLNDNTKYWLRIRVTDMAGRVTEGAAITQTTKKAGLAWSELKIGDYVDYQPDTATNATYSTTQDGAERSGYRYHIISRDTSLTWRILSVSSSKIELIATTQSSSTLTLSGQDGYNNGVKLLNDACNELYKNTTLGATGRSVNVDDINRLMGVTPSTALDSNYGREYTPNYKTYPEMFQYERWGNINGSYTGSLGQSEQSSWYSGGGTASTLKGKYSFYKYTLSNYKATSTVQYALGSGKPYDSYNPDGFGFWLASRYVYLDSTTAAFSLWRVCNGLVWNSEYDLYSGLNSNHNNSYYVRPVVAINLSSVSLGATGDGSSGNKYSISKR